MRWLVVLVCVGCGGGGLDSPLVGDWWECVDAACTGYDQDAARFDDNGTWTMLRVQGHYAPPEPYCGSTSDADRGTYVLDGGHLALTDRLGRDAGGSTVVFHDNMFDVHPDNGGGTWYQRITVVMFTGDCVPF